MKVKTYDTVDIVKKFIGQVYPVGETERDEAYFENLEELARVVEYFLCDICEISKNKSHSAYSMNRAGQYAHRFIEDMRDEINRYLKSEE